MTNARKGQVAMEYLATYGWALLALFVVIAFLVGSGIFNPNRFTSEECTFSPNLPCGSFFIATSPRNDLTLDFNLTDAMGYPIYIANGSARIDANSVKCDSTNGCGVYLNQGDTSRLSFPPFPAQAAKVSADVKRAYVTLTWRNCQDLALAQCKIDNPAMDANYPWHVVSGRITAFVRNTQ